MATPGSRGDPRVRLALLGVMLAVLLAMLDTMIVGTQWMPSNLEKLGYTAVNASTILRNSSLWGLPFSVPVALLYGFWSSRKTVVLLILLNLAAMLAFALGGVGLLRHKALTELLLIIPTWSAGLLASVLAVYAVEIYPTVNRSRGGGLAAGATKLGGVLILALAATAFAAPSVASTAVIALVPMALALVVIIRYGPETNRRTLEQISAAISSRCRACSRFAAIAYAGIMPLLRCEHAVPVCVL